MAMRQTRITGGQSDAKRKFSGYKKEGSKPIRAAHVVESRLIAKFRKIWKRYEWDYLAPEVSMHRAYLREHKKACEAIGTRVFSAPEIGLFPYVIQEVAGTYVNRSKEGILLSAMINSSRDQDFELDVTSLNNIENLLLYNIKNVRLKASTIVSLGSEMKAGRVLVEADLVTWIHMKKGEMRVDGKVARIDSLETDGKITVEGDIDNVAWCHGGEIRASGKIGRVEGSKGCLVYENGDKRI